MRDPSGDPEQVPGTDAGRESRAKGVGSRGGGLPWPQVGDLASSAGATERREGGDVTHSLHSASPATPQHRSCSNTHPTGTSSGDVQARGSEPESPDGGRRHGWGHRGRAYDPGGELSLTHPTGSESPLLALSLETDWLPLPVLPFESRCSNRGATSHHYLPIGTAMGGGGAGPKLDRRWERLAGT